MNYKTKRIRAGLTPYTVAKELGIDYEKYQLIEKKKLPLEGDLMDRFLNIIEPKNAKMIRINRIQRVNDIKEFAENGKLEKLMKDRCYKQTDLAKALGISDSEVSRAIHYKEGTKTPGDDALERIYDFLKNPLNKKVEEVKEKVNTIPTEEEKEKIKKFMEDHNLTNKELAEAIGYNKSTINNIFGAANYLSQKAKEKLFEYMEQYENKVEEPIEEVIETTTPIELTMPIDSNYYKEKVIIAEETPVEEIANEIVKETTELVEPTEKETMPESAYQEFIRLLDENYHLKDELSKAQTQLRRYEKLIDRM